MAKEKMDESLAAGIGAGLVIGSSVGMGMGKTGLIFCLIAAAIMFLGVFLNGNKKRKKSEVNKIASKGKNNKKKNRK